MRMRLFSPVVVIFLGVTRGSLAQDGAHANAAADSVGEQQQHSIDCAAECSKLVSERVEQVNAEWKRRLEEKDKQCESTTLAERQCRADLVKANSKCEKQLEETVEKKKMEIQEEFTRMHMERVTSMEQGWQTRLEKAKASAEQETKLRRKAEKQVKALEQKMEQQLEMFQETQKQLEAQVQKYKRDLEFQKKMASTPKTYMGASQKQFDDTKQMLFEARRESLVAHEHIRELYANATYVNVTMIAHDVGAFLGSVQDVAVSTYFHISEIAAPWWNQVMDVLKPLAKTLGAQWREHISPRIETGVQICTVMHKQHIQPVIDTSVRPALEPALGPVLEFREKVLATAIFLVHRTSGLLLVLLEADEKDESKIARFLARALTASEEHSEAVVHGMELACYSILVLGVLFALTRRKKTKKAPTVEQQSRLPSAKSAGMRKGQASREKVKTQ